METYNQVTFQGTSEYYNFQLLLWKNLVESIHYLSDDNNNKISKADAIEMQFETCNLMLSSIGGYLEEGEEKELDNYIEDIEKITGGMEISIALNMGNIDSEQIYQIKKIQRSYIRKLFKLMTKYSLLPKQIQLEKYPTFI